MFSLINFIKVTLSSKVPAMRRTVSQALSSTHCDARPVTAIVTQAIVPGRTGQVKFQGSWWTARCSQNIILSPGKLVHIIDRQTITLYVEPVFLNAQGH